MAGTLISGRLPPNIDQTKAALAYGDRALPKLNEGLKSGDLLVRQQALRTLCDYLHDPEHIGTALQHRLHLSLQALLHERDVTVRNKTTEAFYILSTHCAGRDAILRSNTIEDLAKLLSDPEDVVRRNMHLCLEMISEIPFGAAGVLQNGLVPPLVEKLKTEHDEIKKLILDTLHFAMRVDTEDALISNSMNVFNELLHNEDATLRMKAARDVMDLCTPLAGKERALEVGALETLIYLLKDDNTEVRAKAAGAISVITITTPGKYQALKADVIDSLVPLIDDECSEVRLNTIKALTCLSEAPEGRKELLEKALDKIQPRLDDHSAAVRKASRIAIKIITWLP